MKSNRKLGILDFMIRRVPYREAIPEARTKWQAEQAETQARQAIFEGRYSKLQRKEIPTLKHFIEETYLPWAKANKRSYQSDHWRSQVLIDWFNGKRLDEISPFLIEKFKRERHEGKTRRGIERSPASVNRELELLSRILTMAVEGELLETNPYTAGTRLADAGADAFTIKEILGHGSIQTSARYVHATDESKRRAVEALASDSSQKVCHKIVTSEERRLG